MLSIEIKNVWNLLGKITGETENEEIINEIFSRFCLEVRMKKQECIWCGCYGSWHAGCEAALALGRLGTVLLTCLNLDSVAFCNPSIGEQQRAIS